MAAIPSGQASFAAAVLKGIGAPVTPQNIQGFVGWAKAEGGSNWSRNNPLNTSESMGSTSTFNSDGVRGYPNTQAGINATIKTLKNGFYGGIIQAFKANNPHALGGAIGSSPWGTSGSLAAQTIAATLGESVPSVNGATTAIAKQMAGAPKGASQTLHVPGLTQTDWGSALADAMMRESATPIDMSGKVKVVNPLSEAIGLASTGAYTKNVGGQNITIPGAGATKAVAQQKMAAVTGHNGLVNPLAGFSGLSFDKGIDGSARPGTPIRSPAASTLVEVVPDFYKGQPLLLFKFDHPIPGAPSQYWFTSEQINPVTRTVGSRFAAGQPVATFASSGTGMETGWGSPHTNDRRFAPVEAHYGQAHTGWGWHFAKFFGIA